MNNLHMLRPQTLGEALASLSGSQGQTKLLAGGTDLVVKLKEGLVEPAALVDLTALKELQSITSEDGFIKIGAACTLTKIAESQLIRKHGFCLAQAASEVGAEQIRNRATIGGNIGNASPAADTVPALIALGAMAAIAGQNGVKHVPVEQLFTGPGKTILAPTEIITHLAFPIPGANESGFYLKLGRRKAQAISVVNMAAVVALDEQKQKFAGARMAIGSVAPTVLRLKQAEDALIGREISMITIDAAAAIVEESIKPISDVRASAEYRKKVSRKLAVKLIWEALALQGITLDC